MSETLCVAINANEYTAEHAPRGVGGGTLAIAASAVPVRLYAGRAKRDGHPTATAESEGIRRTLELRASRDPPAEAPELAIPNTALRAER